MVTRDMWDEVFRRFGKENSMMNVTHFCAGVRFALCIEFVGPIARPTNSRRQDTW